MSESAESTLALQQLKQLVAAVIAKTFPRLSKSARTYPDPDKRPLKWFEYTKGQRRGSLRCFAKYLLSRQETQVVTFNYDLLLDNAVEVEQITTSPSVRTFHAGRCYGFHALKWTSDGAISAMERRPQQGDLHILKMHGSVNWRTRKTGGSPIFPEHVLIMSSHETSFDERPEAQVAVQVEFEAEPLIVPPLLNKAAFLQFPVLNVVWSRAAAYIRRASRIVFIGYSFPVTDFAIECLFRFNTKPACRIQVVNPRPDEARYRSIFPQMRKGDFSLVSAARFCNGLA